MSYIQITETVRHDVYPAIDPRVGLKGAVRGKNVLITGGGRGLGKAIALAFALGGAQTIIITARSEGELESARAEILNEAKLEGVPRVLTHVTDVSSVESVDGLFRMLDSEGVLPDVLVNNAGYLEKCLPVHETDPEDWWKAWEVNIKGTYLPTRALLKSRHALNTTSEATIICTSSIGAIRPRLGYTAYQASKAATSRFAEGIHLEYGDKGVRVFAYHPGMVITKLVADGMSQEAMAAFVDTPELAAGICLWLASQRAADSFRGKYVSSNWDVEQAEALAKQHAGVKDWLLTRPVHEA